MLVTEDLVVATKLGRNPLKLRENKVVVDLLEAREPGIEVSVLETRPAGRLTPTIGRGVVRTLAAPTRGPRRSSTRR